LTATSEERTVLATLSPIERDFVEHLLRLAPDYRYERSGRKRVYPPPAPGFESAVLAAKMASASAATW
jgi:hypothetical protein